MTSNLGWATESDALWCTVSAGQTGNGSITATFAENLSTLPRTANITVSAAGVAPVVVTVEQAGAAQTNSLTIHLLLEGLYNGTNLHKAQDENGDHFAGTIADMLSIELHDAMAPYAMVGTAFEAELSLDGTVTLSNLPSLYNGNYYIVVKHRSSLETWSASPILLNGEAQVYDFTDASTKAYGNLLKLMDTRYALYAGDANQDGAIDQTDAELIALTANLFIGGYVPQDLNGDAVVDALDLILVDNNAANVITTVRP